MRRDCGLGRGCFRLWDFSALSVAGLRCSRELSLHTCPHRQPQYQEQQIDGNDVGLHASIQECRQDQDDCRKKAVEAPLDCMSELRRRVDAHGDLPGLEGPKSVRVIMISSAGVVNSSSVRSTDLRTLACIVRLNVAEIDPATLTVGSSR